MKQILPWQVHSLAGTDGKGHLLLTGIWLRVSNDKNTQLNETSQQAWPQKRVRSS